MRLLHHCHTKRNLQRSNFFSCAFIQILVVLPLGTVGKEIEAHVYLVCQVKFCSCPFVLPQKLYFIFQTLAVASPESKYLFTCAAGVPSSATFHIFSSDFHLPDTFCILTISTITIVYLPFYILKKVTNLHDHGLFNLRH